MDLRNGNFKVKFKFALFSLYAYGRIRFSLHVAGSQLCDVFVCCLCQDM